ncbi:MAG: alpha/beta fold hydrolase, partial [Bryobacteraceae bacterium]
MIELKPGRRGPCIFLVPGLGGRVEGFSDLATLLDTEIPLFAIEAQGVDSVSDPDQDMHAMVQHYIDRIKTVQKDGPYFLMGRSFGGAVVFEMAQRIVAMRDRVGCLILLDTCFVPVFAGAFLSSDSKAALWARFFMGAPQRRSGCVRR